MTPRYITIKRFMALTGLSYSMVRRRISDGRLQWAKEGRWYMIDINAYYVRLKAQQKTVSLRPILTLPKGGITAHIKNEQRRGQLKDYQQERLL